jgi:hypothetical protein
MQLSGWRADAVRICQAGVPATVWQLPLGMSMAQRAMPTHKRRPRVDHPDEHDPVMPRSVPSSDPSTVAAQMIAADDVDELAALPLLLTIRQAAKVLGICPAKAYEMAHRYEATECEGLPVTRIDRLYRVPRWAFAVFILTGRVVTLAELEKHARQVHQQLGGQPSSAAVEPVEVPRPRSSRPRSSRVRPAGRVGPSSGRRSAGSVEQLRLLPGD